MYRNPNPEHWQRPRGRKRATKLLVNRRGFMPVRPLICIPPIISELDDVIDSFKTFQSNPATLTVPFMPNGVLKTTAITDTLTEHQIRLADFGQNRVGLALTFEDRLQAAKFRLLYPGEVLNEAECAEALADRRRRDAEARKAWAAPLIVRMTLRYNALIADIETTAG